MANRDSEISAPPNDGETLASASEKDEAEEYLESAQNNVPTDQDNALPEMQIQPDGISEHAELTKDGATR